MYDIIIVGAGIVGLATAYSITGTHPQYKVAIIEKEKDVAEHQTGHNSGVMHSGIYYQPGSLKAKNCTEGYRKLIEFADENEIEYEICGKVIVATDKSQLPVLEGILEKGKKNGLKGLKMLNQAETLAIEPHVNCVQSILVPQAGIINYRIVSQKLKKNLENRGVDFFFSAKVTGVEEVGAEVVVHTLKGDYLAKKVTICGGLYADKLAVKSGVEMVEAIVPFRGEYYTLSREKQHMVNNLIYPVPNPSFPFLGVHYTRLIEGGIEAGPNAVLAFRREGYSRWDIHVPELAESLFYPGFRKLAKKYWKEGFDELHRSFSKRAFVKALQHLIPEIGYDDLKRGKSGVRAQALDRHGNMVDDFLIKRKGQVINVINAPSPAATSCLAIGEHIAAITLE